MLILLPYKELDELSNPNNQTKKSYQINLGKKKKAKQLLSNHSFEHKLPVIVIINRFSPRRLDDDNLVARCKLLRDWVAEQLGISDDSCGVFFEYRQCVTAGDRLFTVEILNPTESIINEMILSYKNKLNIRLFSERD